MATESSRQADNEWLLKMAEKEDGKCISAGGWVAQVNAAEQTESSRQAGDAGGARDAEHDRRWFTEWAPSIGAVGDARVAAGTLRQLMLAALHWIGEHKDARAECQRLAAELAAALAGREAVKPSTQGDTHAD